MASCREGKKKRRGALMSVGWGLSYDVMLSDAEAPIPCPQHAFIGWSLRLYAGTNLALISTHLKKEKTKPKKKEEENTSKNI